MYGLVLRRALKVIIPRLDQVRYASYRFLTRAPSASRRGLRVTPEDGPNLAVTVADGGGRVAQNVSAGVDVGHPCCSKTMRACPEVDHAPGLRPDENALRGATAEGRADHVPVVVQAGDAHHAPERGQ